MVGKQALNNQMTGTSPPARPPPPNKQPVGLMVALSVSVEEILVKQFVSECLWI